MKTAVVAGKPIGPGHPLFVVMEMGVTHEARMDVAARMIRASAQAGADAVKCECIRADLVVGEAHRAEMIYSFPSRHGGVISENYYELLRRVSLSLDDIAALKVVADDHDLPFFATAFDLETVDFLKRIGSCAVKVSSGELTHLPLIEHAARSGLPLFLDTGRATLGEICRGVSTALAAGCENLVVMHNPSGYPAPPADVHLRLIPLLEEVLHVPAGFSCHTRGDAVALASVACGARVVEKPISRDNTLDEDEHAFSVNIDDVAAYVRALRDVEAALGSAQSRLVPLGDERTRQTFRQSVVTTRALPAGHVLGRDDLTFARPGWGIAPHHVDGLVGRVLGVALPSGHVVAWDDLLRSG